MEKLQKVTCAADKLDLVFNVVQNTLSKRVMVATTAVPHFLVLRFSWLLYATRLLQTKEEFNNEMQSLTSKHSQDIEEVKERMSVLQVRCVYTCSVCLELRAKFLSR